MNELNLLIFGCVVTFVAIGGAYVYVRECFTEDEVSRAPTETNPDVIDGNFRDVA